MSLDLQAFKDQQRRLWSAGDYSVAARRYEDAARELVAACGLRPGQRALDIGAGDGNGALAIARSGASPEACDLVPELVAAGKARCNELGEWEIPWGVADCEALPYADGRYDGVVSVFGLIFAPRPDVAIAEAFRVTRSRGVVGLTAWTPGSAAARFAAVAAKYFPPAAQAPPSPYEWGVEEVVRARVAPWAADVRFELDAVTFAWPSAAAAREENETANNFVAAARAALPPERFAQYLDDVDALMAELNTATDGGLRYDAEYARIVVRKAG